MLITPLLLLAFVQATDASLGPLRPSPFPVRPVELNSAYIHGTIDVVVSTRHGFVLASDSRASHSDSPPSDDAQKIFKVGNRTACVIAGLIGADLGAQGFHLRDALATYLISMDEWALHGSQPTVRASEVAGGFSESLTSVVGLLLPNFNPANLVAAVSAVSLSDKGTPDWSTIYVPIDLRKTQIGIAYFTPAQPIYIAHSTKVGLRFDVEALGFPLIADELLGASAPTNIAASHSPILRKYYRRKRMGRLDDYTLEEGIELAKFLVATTIALAPPEAGVGGPIDVVTVTKSGTTWVSKKSHVAPPPPVYSVRLFFMNIERSSQGLDGLECVRCTFRDTVLYYNGDADAELLGPVIEGSCKLVFGREARKKKPLSVDYLTGILADKCQIETEE